MATGRQLDHKIWDIAWPAILSNISVPLLGLVDAAILGHLGSTQYLGAVAIGGAVLSFLYWGFSFLRMGTTGLVAKATGAGRPDEAALVLAQSAVLALLIAVVVVATHPLWLEIGFTLMSPQAELAPLADSYASIRIFSAPAVLITYTIVGWFIGNQNTRWPMVIMVSTNILNIGLDFLFIMGLGLNSDGAAYATLVAEYAGNDVRRVFDVGVAGIHRLFHQLDDLREASVIVVAAGMEGALASVIGGLVACPVVAVPTSVGYGASFNGIAALLGMLNSCAAGVTVVNIDNGFGAGYAAAMINRVGRP